MIMKTKKKKSDIILIKKIKKYITNGENNIKTLLKNNTSPKQKYILELSLKIIKNNNKNYNTNNNKNIKDLLINEPLLLINLYEIDNKKWKHNIHSPQKFYDKVMELLEYYKNGSSYKNSNEEINFLNCNSDIKSLKTIINSYEQKLKRNENKNEVINNDLLNEYETTLLYLNLKCILIKYKINEDNFLKLSLNDQIKVMVNFSKEQLMSYKTWYKSSYIDKCEYNKSILDDKKFDESYLHKETLFDVTPELRQFNYGHDPPYHNLKKCNKYFELLIGGNNYSYSKMLFNIMRVSMRPLLFPLRFNFQKNLKGNEQFKPWKKLLKYTDDFLFEKCKFVGLLCIKFKDIGKRFHRTDRFHKKEIIYIFVFMIKDPKNHISIGEYKTSNIILCDIYKNIVKYGEIFEQVSATYIEFIELTEYLGFYHYTSSRIVPTKIPITSSFLSRFNPKEIFDKLEKYKENNEHNKYPTCELLENGINLFYDDTNKLTLTLLKHNYARNNTNYYKTLDDYIKSITM